MLVLLFVSVIFTTFEHNTIKNSEQAIKALIKMTKELPKNPKELEYNSDMRTISLVIKIVNGDENMSATPVGRSPIDLVNHLSEFLPDKMNAFLPINILMDEMKPYIDYLYDNVLFEEAESLKNDLNFIVKYINDIEFVFKAIQNLQINHASELKTARPIMYYYDVCLPSYFDKKYNVLWSKISNFHDLSFDLMNKIILKKE
ncbi:hypothetical protein TCON_2652 [Astathelohania contejeani]|uniref:Uncharacterized protein n=1 Tax=Astathelohania contejeani TaxID=164912 RepID=A0ABQ7HVE6_9MICR|nr:hypothetical protein TCON_2652 [Thelohania contejeani]